MQLYMSKCVQIMCIHITKNVLSQIMLVNQYPLGGDYCSQNTCIFHIQWLGADKVSETEDDYTHLSLSFPFIRLSGRLAIYIPLNPIQGISLYTYGVDFENSRESLSNLPGPNDFCIYLRQTLRYIILMLSICVSYRHIIVISSRCLIAGQSHVTRKVAFQLNLRACNIEQRIATDSNAPLIRSTAESARSIRKGKLGSTSGADNCACLDRREVWL